jgi:hypothetical protein
MIKKILDKLEYRGINLREFAIAVTAFVFLASMISICIVGLVSSAMS